jgi:hypothetical protein
VIHIGKGADACICILSLLYQTSVALTNARCVSLQVLSQTVTGSVRRDRGSESERGWKWERVGAERERERPEEKGRMN